MRLLFVIKSLGVAGGGAERVLVDVAGALAERGHRVTIATFDAAGMQSFYPVAEKVAVIHLAIGNTRVPTGAGEFVARVRALRRLSRQARPDVAIGFSYSAYVLLGAALVGSGIPVVGSEHIVFEHYRERRLQRLALRLSAPLLQAMTAVSEFARASFPRALQRKMVVIPNPVVVAAASSAKPDRRLGKTLLSVGRLDPQKDQATLIAAFGQIADRFPDWTLRILGEGSLRPQLEMQVRALGLGGRVEMPGAVRDIGAEYSAAQLFALPSRYESFGLATAEAMGHGLPVIGFADCAGTNELIEHDVNGLLIDGVARTNPLAGALAYLMDSPETRERLGAAARSSLAQLSINQVADRWQALLRITHRNFLDRTSR